MLGVIILFFGIGPAKISPIYPPAGIAVAAVIVLGPGILPAVFIGEFLNGFPLFFLPDTTVKMYVLANIGVGIGAVLEAWIGARLLERLAGTWHPFDRSRDVVVFLLGSSLAAALARRHDRLAVAVARRLRAARRARHHLRDVLPVRRLGDRGVRRARAGLGARAAARPHRDRRLPDRASPAPR